MSSRRRRKFTSVETELHFVNLATWLAMESEAEVRRMEERRRQQSREDAEKSGESILDLVIRESESGLGGHHLITLVRRNPQQPMPWHRLKVGSPVVVSPIAGSGRNETGVVSRKRADSLQVALKRWVDGDRFRVDLTVDEATRQRQLAAIGQVKDARGRLGQLRDILAGERVPEFGVLPEPIEFVSELNPSQQAAVNFGLTAKDLAILHGPPGTGKTTTVVELIVQAARRGERVLACAPSNTATDNLLERLVALGQRVVRVGHPARVSEALRDYSVDGRVAKHEHVAIAKDMRREAEQLFRQADRWTRAKRKQGDRQSLRFQARQLQRDARELERLAVDQVLDQAQIICGTTTFPDDLLGDRKFDLAVIDEACQSTEPGCWVPLLRADRLVMAGDHQQLPPTILSSEAADQGFAVSLMERQVNLWGEQATRMLSMQYRMHQEIMNFSSGHFYDDQLEAHPSVAEHRLCELPGVTSTPLTEPVISMIDSAGAGWDEELEPEGFSKRNPSEARLVGQLVEQLLEAGVAPEDLAIIAPYAAQVRLIRSLLKHRTDLEVDTVDGFQGREKEVVLISMVRSNTFQEIGFLADQRRMNVALTRARRRLILIGDSATLGIDEFYRDLLAYIDSVGDYRTIWEFDVESAAESNS